MSTILAKWSEYSTNQIIDYLIGVKHILRYLKFIKTHLVLNKSRIPLSLRGVYDADSGMK